MLTVLRMTHDFSQLLCSSFVILSIHVNRFRLGERSPLLIDPHFDVLEETCMLLSCHLVYSTLELLKVRPAGEQLKIVDNLVSSRCNSLLPNCLHLPCFRTSIGFVCCIMLRLSP